MAALAVLGGFFLWGRYDANITSKYLEKYQPIPLPEKPTLRPEDDVSIIVCTLNPPARFLPCLRQWLANNPLEVIISTTAEHIDEVRRQIVTLEEERDITSREKEKIRLVMSPKKGVRSQFITGVNAARGAIIARCDDHITWDTAFLEHMLAPLDPAAAGSSSSDAIGAVLPLMQTYVAEARRSPESATPWETAMTRGMHNRNPGVKALWAGQKWCICLVGLSFLIRTDIVTDAKFQHAFLNDTWRGAHLDAGDDTFLTRWLQSHDQLIAVQATPATTVSRTVKLTRAFIPQMLRWERSSIQSFLRTLTGQVPQIWTRSDSLYVARKTLERVLRPLLTAMHLWAWASAAVRFPALAALLLAVCVGLALPGHVAFYRRYPWMVRYWWAGVLVDFAYVVQDPICWATLSDVTWKRGEEV